MESQRHLRPIKRVRQSRVREGDVIRHQVKCPAQTPSSFPTFWKFCLTFRVSLRDSRNIATQRKCGPGHFALWSGKYCYCGSCLGVGQPPPHKQILTPRIIYRFEVPPSLSLPSFKHYTAFINTIPLQKKNKEGVF